MKKEHLPDRECRELTEEMEEIFEGSFDGILVTDDVGNILYVNSSYERVTEIKCSEMRGKNMRDFINPIWMPNSVAFVVAEQKRPISKRQVTKSGRHIIVTGRPIMDKNGSIKKIVINVRDITEIYELTEELQESKELGKLFIDNFSDYSAINGKSETPFLAVSASMQDVLSMAKKVAPFQTTVLITGESGVGKEGVARYIHDNGLRKGKPFIVINCGAIPANLLESELFGYEKGAFTGAMLTGKEGLLEAADGGTVFLDEIGEIPPDFQVKLLRFLEGKEVRRVGSNETKTIDVRIIAATNRDLLQMAVQGIFREDLYYRLNIVQIHVPSLRTRTDDIVPLSSLFLHIFNERYNQNKHLTPEVSRALKQYPWEGNVRQLKNVVENMIVVSNNDYLQIEDLPWVRQETKGSVHKLIHAVSDSNLPMPLAIEELEKLMLKQAKEKHQTSRELAQALGIDQSTVVRKLNKYGI